MKIFSGTTDFYTENKSAVAIGKFDGVHLGHLAIVKELLREKEKGVQSVVMTFDPSPEIFFGFGPERELSTTAEKRELFEKAGVDILVEFPFNKDTAAIPADTFVEKYLIEKLHASFIVAGSDLSFGDRGAGNFELLRKLSKRFDYETSEIAKIEWNDQVISSTLIRDLVSKGEMESVAQCLGRPFSVSGEIVHGNALGRTIDIPTINLRPEAEKILPPFGVYYSLVEIDGVIYPGMTNIGLKPTIRESTKSVTVETYLYDFQKDVYGKKAKVMFLTFKRPEICFDGIEPLKAQMREDTRAGQIYHKENREKWQKIILH